LDLAEQGINCLWGSFEIKNTRLVHKLLKQFARGPILPTLEDGSTSQTSESVEKLKALADRFEGLPLYFMKFHGGSEVDDVLDAMEYAVYVNDVEHIILDNLQFMISRIGGKGSTFDKFDVQDVAIEKFRKFSTEHNVHITLVVHPRKEDETSKLNMSSFYGSAKATQEADTVAILQNDGRRKYIEVKKNRFDGTLGYTPLHFHRESGRYVEDEQGIPDSGGVELPSTTFSTSPFKPKPKPFFAQSPPQPEKEIEGLENFWNNCLAPKRA
jgi:twinkle protein